MKLRKREVSIDISRFTSNVEPKMGFVVNIETRDDGKILLRGELTPEEFSSAITGKPVKFEAKYVLSEGDCRPEKEPLLDYRRLLMKYMYYVEKAEGTTLLEGMGVDEWKKRGGSGLNGETLKEHAACLELDCEEMEQLEAACYDMDEVCLTGEGF